MKTQSNNQMNKEDYFAKYSDVPEIIEPTVIMEEANSTILIFEGEYILKKDGIVIKITGKINFDWFPSQGVHFSGKPIIEFAEFDKMTNDREPFYVFVNGLEFGQGRIPEFTFRGNEILSIKGVMDKEAVLGDKTISVSKIHFSIPNLIGFAGEEVKKIESGTIKISTNRLQFEDDKYIIKLDKCLDYDKRKEALEKKGGYLVLYAGELISKKGSISYSETNDLLCCLDAFLTFLNGRKTSTLFIQGIFEDTEIWRNYTNFFIDTYKIVKTWPKRNVTLDFNDLWNKFSKIWKNCDDRGFLKSSIHWYAEANGNSGFTEGSIIMAQTALELIYNWWIIEQKKMILGKDAENINAANKIRLLLSQLNVNYNSPTEFKYLNNFISTTDNILDAPEAIVYIRNAIVHSQEEKRKKLSSIDDLAIKEALQLYLWYIEISLLRILDYNNQYSNRCINEYKLEEYVPWNLMKK